MKIAFYAPLKSPLHPVPSGDRLMARMLWAALQAGGHVVVLASQLRSYCGDAADVARAQGIADAARAEVVRIAAEWRAAEVRAGVPDLWISYHPYYKSPDLIGPPLCREHGVPYVTIEASYSARRNLGVWAGSQAAVLDAIGLAAVNICLTARDRAGLLAADPAVRVADLPPFIDPAPYLGDRAARQGPVRLICVAMMRAGDKLASYTLLAQALGRLLHLDWRLTVVGAGSMQPQVHALFAGMAGRVDWAGVCDAGQVAVLLKQADIYLWPGFGEAYGLAYLEAQAAGLPVVALAVAGVPEVVGPQGGVLVPQDDAGGDVAGDVAGYAAAVAGLICDAGARVRLGAGARARVLHRHSMDAAVARLGQIVQRVVR